jgi:hypothetical protein
MDNSGEIYLDLLDRLRRDLPEVADQIESEVIEGRRVVTETLSESERTDRAAKMRDVGSRISKEDLATVPYTDDERLALLVEALLCLGSAMATDREAVAGLLEEQQAHPTIRLRSEETTQVDTEFDIAAEATTAREVYHAVSDPLRQALAELQ